MISWVHIISWRAERHPDLPALIDDLGQTLTYRELAEEVELLAGGWAAKGVKPGDTVAIVARNRVDWISHMFALNRLGAVPSGINWRLAAPELRTLFSVLQPAAVLMDAPNEETVREAAPDVPAVRLRDADNQGAVTGRASDSFQGPPPPFPVDRLQPKSPCVLLHTSGTTSAVPKLVTISHSRLVSSATYLKLVVPEAVEGARHLRAMPLFHMAGLANITYPLFSGGTTYIQSSFNPGSFVHALVSEQIQFTNLVPSAIAMVVEEIRSRPDPVDLSSLIEIGYGASPISPDALRDAITTLGCRFRQNYGSTETGGFPVTTLDPEDQYPESPHLNTAGKVAMNWNVRIVDDEMRDVPDGEPGELIVRGSDPFDGYWNNPEATAEAMTDDGFWRLGDVAVRDREGYIKIIDRLKDMIVSGGENVYPAEVESVLSKYPGVREVSVIGIPDPRWGEAVHAVIVMDPAIEADINSDAADAITTWCRTQIASFKCPRSISFMDELPRSATGKILKRELRKGHWTNNERGVA